MTDRELMQDALEALEDVPYMSNKDDYERLERVKSALRQALRARLSQPEPAECQREWVGLTEDEIEQAAQGGDTNFWDFCRIIEAKLKEKNNG
jgi:hypothetical protein